jgi:peptide/nickel transport system substrate-binding protein
MTPAKETGSDKPQYGGVMTVLAPDYRSDDMADAINATNGQQSFTNDTLLICHWDWPTEKCGFFGVEMDSITDPEEWLVPALATSFERIDPTTVRFHLRKGVRWNAGLPEARKLVGDREFVASDVEWYFKYVMASPKHTGRWDGVVESVKAVDKYTVEAKAKRVDVFFIAQIAAGAYTAIHCPEVGKKYGNFKDWKNNVGTGAFIRTNLVPGSSATFEKNPGYWGYDEKHPENIRPYVDKVREVFLTDIATELAAFRTGKMDQLYNSGMTRHHLADLLSTNPDIGVAKFNTGNSYWSIRNDIAPFNDIKVRSAMNKAVNRQEILDEFYGGEGEVWSNPYPPIYADIYIPFDTLPEDIKELYSYDPAKAKQLLAEAGYPNGFKTSLVYYAPTGSELHEKNALIAQYLAKVGIEVELRLVDSATNSSMRYGFTYPQIYGDGMGVNYPEQFYQVWYVSTGAWNRCRVNDKYIDETVAKAMGTLDVKARRAMFRELDMYVLRHCYDLTPVNGLSYTVWQPWVKGYAGQRSLYFQGRAEIYSRIWLDLDMREDMTGKR